MPEELCQVSPKSHYVSIALHSDPSPFSSIIIIDDSLKTLRKGILGAESCVGIYILDKSVRQLSRRSRITFTLDHLHCSPPLLPYKDLTILRDSKTRRHMQSCRKICTLDQQSSNLQTNENMKSSCKQKFKNTSKGRPFLRFVVSSD